MSDKNTIPCPKIYGNSMFDEIFISFLWKILKMNSKMNKVLEIVKNNDLKNHIYFEINCLE